MMNGLNATVISPNGFKEYVVISIDYRQYIYQHDFLDEIRKHVNLHYNWKFLEFEAFSGKYTMLNDRTQTVICTFQYFGVSSFMDIVTYVNNGRNVVRRLPM